MGTTLLTVTAAWRCGHPSEAMLAAHASDPELAAPRVDFADQVRRSAESSPPVSSRNR